MTWRPILTIFDLFSKINRSDKAPIQARMAVLLACPSLSGKSKHRSCQRALLATFPQESVSAAHVFSEQKKLWARCFKNCLSSESKMLIVGAFSDDMARASCWEWLLRSSSGRLLHVCKTCLRESPCVSVENFVWSLCKGLVRRRARFTFNYFLI